MCSFEYVPQSLFAIDPVQGLAEIGAQKALDGVDGKEGLWDILKRAHRRYKVSLLFLDHLP
jgi:hypothetical protein